MSIGKMQRIIVGLKKSSDYKIPKFSECIIDFFSKDSNSVIVSCTLQGNVLIVSASDNGYKLQHSPECPFKIISQNEHKDIYDGVKTKLLNVCVAVSVIIESSDKYILLTKRPSHMRSSPRVWVPPGGHLEPGETLYEGGVREIKEETGLNVLDGKESILCLWENVYPLLLGLGSPTNHVLVIYYRIQMNESYKELQQKIKIDPKEVESYCWLSATSISELIKYNKTSTPQKQYVLENNKIVEKDLNTSTMFNSYLWNKREPHSGVQAALMNWHERYGLNTVHLSKF